MKEILAIIRLVKLSETKKALAEAGFPAFTCRKVLGRGKNPIDFGARSYEITESNLLPKRALTLIVNNNDVDKVVSVIMEANHTGHSGDGKIFVIPIKESYKVSNGRGGADAY